MCFEMGVKKKNKGEKIFFIALISVRLRRGLYTASAFINFVVDKGKYLMYNGGDKIFSRAALKIFFYLLECIELRMHIAKPLKYTEQGY